MIAELVERVRTAREEKGLSIAEVAEATRIPQAYLEAVEEGAFDQFTSPLHLRGFLRNYAHFLNLDPAEILAEYDRLQGSPLPAEGTAGPLAQATSGRGSTLGADLLLGLVLVALLGLVGFSVYLRQNHLEPTPTPGPPLTPTATAVPVREGTAYEMDVDLDYQEHQVAVWQRVDYTNATSETLEILVLNVHPNYSQKLFKLNDVRVDVDGEPVKAETSLLAVQLTIDLPRPLPAGDHVVFFLDYSLELPRIDPQAQFARAGFGYSKSSISLGNWYPVMAPYREDKGWYNQAYFDIGDPYVTEVADYSVSITATQGVVISATGQETRDGDRWHFEARKARSFALAASDKYQVATTQVGDVTVSSYFFPADQEAGEAALETGAQALGLFAELYGPYPYADYRLAETEFAGGLEFTGLAFLGSAFYSEYDGTSRTPLIPLTAHETAHQWFYGLVGNDQVTEPWLDEAPAEYSAFLYYERFLPDDTDWWWFYAVDQWAPTGRVDSHLYLFRNDSRPYYDAVYRRGAQFMGDLRETMGDPAFFSFLAEYQRRYAYQIARSRDFFTLVQEFTTADLVPLQEEYFQQRILP
jgi:transcriptional regulator with XRE-family HTH domain